MKRLSLLLLSLAACNFSKDAAPASEAPAAPVELEEQDEAKNELKRDSPARSWGMKRKAPGAPSAKMAKEEAAMDLGGLAAVGGGEGGGGFGERTIDAEPPPPPDAAPTRAWFPESFLFAPLVKTDAQGDASYEIKVPDRLTTWRVLALAHSREGAQAGAVTSFLGTLPVYLDPVVPPFLSTGDEVDLPIQLVNTTNQRLEKNLTLESTGVASVSGSGLVPIPAEGSVVRFARLVAKKPGNVKISAKLAGADAIERTLKVVPTGRPMREEKGGTLAAPRSLAIELPADLEAESATLRLSVFPGALALLRSELATCLGRSGPSEDAYLLLLAGRARGLLQKLGGEVHEENLRTLSLTAAQRALRHTRNNDGLAAVTFAEAALTHPDNPVLARLGDRLVMVASQNQRPDGTFFGESGWTVQRLLVATADGVQAVRAGASNDAGKRRAARTQLLAGGAVERMIGRVEDPYTAAALLAAGAVEGVLADKLRQRVRDALTAQDDGAKALVPPSGVVRADGQAPGTIEATALAVLALETDPQAKPLLADLGATLLGAYRPGPGFGDGRTNLLALRAVLALFTEPVPSRIEVKVSQDGRVLSSGVLEGDRLKDVVVLEADLPTAAGAHQYQIEATPAVPGLGYTLQLRYYVPWKEEERAQGLELMVDVAKDAAAGRPTDVALRGIAPDGAAVLIHHALPAGVLPDKGSLEALVQAGTIESYTTPDGAVDLVVPEREQGQSLLLRYRVVPTLAGKLHATASSISLQNEPDQIRYVPPATWIVGR